MRSQNDCFHRSSYCCHSWQKYRLNRITLSYIQYIIYISIYIYIYKYICIYRHIYRYIYPGHGTSLITSINMYSGRSDWILLLGLHLLAVPRVVDSSAAACKATPANPTLMAGHGRAAAAVCLRCPSCRQFQWLFAIPHPMFYTDYFIPCFAGSILVNAIVNKGFYPSDDSMHHRYTPTVLLNYDSS